MSLPKILVSGATGRTGSVVAAELLKAGYPVRAMAHREDGRSEQLKARGAEIAVADMSDVERVADALTGVQRAYFCPPYDPYMVQGAVAFAVAAKEARLEHIVGLTDRIRSALATISPDDQSLTVAQLAPLDQFHTRGMLATTELADAVGLEPASRVLDLGCGIGGPATAR